MGLSKENEEKLRTNGLYKCEPVLDWIASYKRNTPYHCINWTFKPVLLPKMYTDKDGNTEWYMKDTYWGLGGDGLRVKLTDENFDKFKLVFCFDEVSSVKEGVFYDYDEEDRFDVAVDSGGLTYKGYFVKKGSKPNKELQIGRLQEELDMLLSKARYLEGEIKRLKEEEI